MPPALLMVGQNVGKYRVLDRVGRGGMGTVYRAIDETLHREVAIKVLNAELNEPEVAKRFRAEAITVARLSHPGIATIYELFQHDDQWLMVMEFVRGETLEQVVARTGSLAPEPAALLCMQSLAALAHAHSMGVVHRDLKPANIMRTDSGDVKIMDFGIARVSGSEHLTSIGFMMGTPAYMAPEQVQGHEIDARADLYAIGVVFFRLLTGQLPFKGDTPFAMAQAQVNAPPMAIETLRQDLPSWVGEVLSRALQKKPDDRFQSATEFHETLQRAVGGGTAAIASSWASLTSSGALIAQPGSLPTAASHAETMLTPAATASGRVAPRTGSVRAAVPQTASPDTPTPVMTPRLETGSVSASPPPPPPPAAAAGPAARAMDLPAADVLPQSPVADVPRARSRWMGPAAAALLLVAAGAWWVISGRQAPVPVEPATDVTALPAPPVIEPAEPEAQTQAPLSASVPSPGTGRSAASGPAASSGRVSGAGRATAAPAAAAAAVESAPAAAEPDPAPVDAAPPVDIANLRVLVIEGRRATDQDATLSLGSGRIAVMLRRDGTPLVTWPYGAVTAATYVHGRSPRWNAALASPPGDLDVGGVFRASRHYLTLQNASEFVILRLEDINVIQVIRELEARTGLTIPRTTGGNN